MHRPAPSSSKTQHRLADRSLDVIDITEAWDVPTHILEALARFDEVAAQIPGVITDTTPDHRSFPYAA